MSAHTEFLPTALPASQRLPIAITAGDPSGIGPEIVAKAFRDAPEVMQGCCVIGSPAVMQRALQCIGGALSVVPLADTAQLWQLPPHSLPVWWPQELSTLSNPELLAQIPYGLVSQTAGKYSVDCVRWAARAALRGGWAAVVTAPIHKEAWRAAGEACPGHTELLQQEAAAFSGQPLASVPVRMMLANDELRTVLVSIHLSLREALAAVTYDNVLQTLRITHASLHATLGRAPRMAVAGLNPHAGEGGLFGREEIEVINPAIAAARAEGLQVSGALPPDTVFMQARGLQRFDVVIAMYHDQGLIPVKYLGVEQGVNVTLGLPLVRTSPDHGTAFDIAGKGVADARSLIAAVHQAKLLVASAQAI
jgi:4-hydroxythreonine-4-phosphate dehydrogenase